MVEVYDDRVEISNPGGLLPVVAAELGHKSMEQKSTYIRLVYSYARC